MLERPSSPQTVTVPSAATEPSTFLCNRAVVACDYNAKSNYRPRVRSTALKAGAGTTSPMMYNYEAYGLTICSDINFPELNCSSDGADGSPLFEPDVIVSEAPDVFAPESLKISTSMLCSYAVNEQTDDVYLKWDDIGAFRISRGVEIAYAPNPTVDEGLLRVVLLGSVMAILLFQRGLSVLHGSAVDIDGRGVAFIGGKGAGKSTIAAALAARGHKVLTDDVIAIKANDASERLTESPHDILPSFPQIKLWPDAAHALGHSVDDLPKVTEVYAKVAVRSVSVNSSNCPLKAIIVLGIDNEFGITKLAPQEALIQVLGNSYVSRFGEAVSRARRSPQFLAIGKIIQSVGVHRLVRPAELSLLNSGAEKIEQFIAQIEEPSSRIEKDKPNHSRLRVPAAS
jgi:hypothetical protein